jgi:hypothetical protein
MAIDRDPNLTSHGSSMHDRDTMGTTSTNTVYDRDTRVHDRDSGGSNFLAFLIGGLVIAVGLLAFLFYDGGSRDVSTTGSTTPRIESPAAPSAPSMPNRPAAPSNPQ